MELLSCLQPPLPTATRKRATSAKIFHVRDKSEVAHETSGKLYPRRSSGALGERGIPLNN